ncbi:MAG: SEL1-like repeat protein [Firmicutes bacterium]|nr:SEL1-like repeat protein [Bacillota bacterium]
MIRMVMAAEEIRRQAQAGDANAQYLLAIKYYKGSGEERDPRQGFLWMKVSAEGGCLRAQKALGLLYTSAQHAPFPSEEPTEAVRMYRLAAEQGDAEAQYWLGQCYMTGYGVEASEEEGKRWISAARAKGYDVEPDPLISRPEEGNASQWEFSKPAEVNYGTPEPEEEGERRSSILGEAQPVQNVPRFDFDYLKTGLIFAGVGCIGGLVLAGIAALILALLAGGSSLYGIITVVFAIAGAVIGFYYGYNVAFQRAGDKLYFRNTPFYLQHQEDYENLDRAVQNQYEIYVTLQKELQPFCYRSPRLAKSPFGNFRGYMIPSMILPGRRGMNVLDLLLVSEKAIYVLNVSGITGNVSGNAEDEEWRVQSYTGRVRYMANPLKKNEADIQSLQDALRALCPGFWLHDVPIYSVAVFGGHANVEKLEGISKEENQFVLAGGGEKVRGFVEKQESRHVLRTKEMTQVMKAVEHLLKQYPENKRKADRERRHN